MKRKSKRNWKIEMEPAHKAALLLLCQELNLEPKLDSLTMAEALELSGGPKEDEVMESLAKLRVAVFALSEEVKRIEAGEIDLAVKKD